MELSLRNYEGHDWATESETDDLVVQWVLENKELQENESLWGSPPSPGSPFCNCNQEEDWEESDLMMYGIELKDLPFLDKLIESEKVDEETKEYWLGLYYCKFCNKWTVYCDFI